MLVLILATFGVVVLSILGAGLFAMTLLFANPAAQGPMILNLALIGAGAVLLGFGGAGCYLVWESRVWTGLGVAAGAIAGGPVLAGITDMTLGGLKRKV